MLVGHGRHPRRRVHFADNPPDFVHVRPSEKSASAVACGPVRSSQSSWSLASSGSRLRLKSGMSTQIELELAVPWGFSSILLLPPWGASALFSKSFRLSIASPSVAIY
jgi:hypothetical protein